MYLYLYWFFIFMFGVFLTEIYNNIYLYSFWICIWAHRQRHSSKIKRNEHASKDIRDFWSWAYSFHRVGESEPSERIRLTGCSDYKMGMLMVKGPFLISGFCDHSWCVEAGWLKNEHASSDTRHKSSPKEARIIAARAQHILAQGKLKLESMHRDSKFGYWNQLDWQV